MSELTAESVARLFHETYERLAPHFGYQTRKASAVPWADVPDVNKSLMVAVAGEVLDTVRPAIEAAAAERQAADCKDAIAALERARNDLLAYGHHLEGQVIHKGAHWDEHRKPGEACRCGLDAALARASAALGEQPQTNRDVMALRQALANNPEPHPDVPSVATVEGEEG